MAQVYCRALRQAGHEVLLIHGPVPPVSILEEMAEAGIGLSLEEGLAFPLSPSVARRVSARAGRFGARAVIGVNQRDRAVALEAAGLLGLPGVLLMQSLHRFWGGWPIASLKRWHYRRILLRWLTLAVCCSQAVQSELIQDFGIEAGRTVVLPNGIELDRFAPLPADQIQAVRPSLGIGSQETLLLNIGRIDYQKGLDILLKALAEVGVEKPYRLVVVGTVTGGAGNSRSQRYHQDLLRLVERLGLGSKVLFAGWRSDVPALLASADAYVHAARYEGWPLAVLEAMAAGVPVVATDCVGRPEGFQDGVQGFIVPTGDSVALARAIQDVLGLDSSQRRAWGQSALQLVSEHYDLRVLAGRFVSLMEGLVS